jgi:3-hydroxybutyryl-CoA dehydrogenase
MKDFAKDSLTVGVVGAGIMGRGIAQALATAGVTVVLQDVKQEVLNEAQKALGGVFDRLVEKGKFKADEAAAIRARITTSAQLAGLAGADLVIEAIIENLELKQGLVRELEAVVRPDCVIATNTSSLSVTAVAAAAKRPGRVAGYHFFNPVPLMKLVEVIAGARSDTGVLEQLVALTRRFGHTPVRVEDSPGFLVNHIGRALVTEGLRVLFENVADCVAVDRVMRDSVGLRMGPFELMDLTGLDVTFPASEQVYNQYFQEPRLRPTPMQRRRYLAGLLGRKTGRGFYVYEDGKKIEPAEPAPPSAAARPAFWISRVQPDAAKTLEKLLRTAGAKLDRAKKPAKGSVILLTPFGLDATTAALDAKLLPERCVAVDMLFNADKRITIMGTPVTESRHLEAVWAALAQTFDAVTVIRDSGGFIAQRIVATMVNIASDIAQQGIAQPADIDTGACLGLAYPKGPLALGDELGAARVLEILENLQRVYADPRYRPSPWLRRRAQLGISLLTSEGQERK